MFEGEIIQEWPWYRTVLQVVLNLLLGLMIVEEITFFLVPGEWSFSVVWIALTLVGIGLTASGTNGLLDLRRRSIKPSLRSIATTPPVLVWFTTSACFLTIVFWILLSGQKY
jgi:hypothetical protein